MVATTAFVASAIALELRGEQSEIPNFNVRIVTRDDVEGLRGGFKFEYPPNLTKLVESEGWRVARPVYAKYHRKALNSYMYRGLLELFGAECAIATCRGVREVEWAHLKPTRLSGPGRGVIDRRYDIQKYPECYVRLCVECHGIFDAGIVTINGIKSTTSSYVGSQLRKTIPSNDY